MYRLLNKAAEDLPAVRRGPDLQVDNVAAFVPDAAPEQQRHDGEPPPVSLPDPKALWAEWKAFEARWTSLAA
ncbi:hypothetical protein [Prosthecobacter sp.]|uniref:hypothetical protein n=1 Tax=Prosthecobacter sp. TaxID=1965333 RepID=UPI0037835F3E